MAIPVLHVDAFASGPFRGNPAAVCLLDDRWGSSWPDDAWLQSFAMEMHLSETAYLRARTGAPDSYDLRWFTPSCEVELCGHATLASAGALRAVGAASAPATITFNTRYSGALTARFEEAGLIAIDLPRVKMRSIDPPAPLAEALGFEPADAGMDGQRKIIAIAPSAEAVRALEPDLSAIARMDAQGVVVTAPADDPDFDFVSRFFAPAVGVAEDPVCGSAHCSLGPYWAARLGKMELRAWQASARGGALRVAVRDDRVELAGETVVTLRGEITDNALPGCSTASAGSV